MRNKNTMGQLSYVWENLYWAFLFFLLYRNILFCPVFGFDYILIHLDIKDFFGSITENMVFNMFSAETGYSKSLSRFLAQMCCFGGRLPQGTVTSPMLSNIVFRRCDEDLSRLSSQYGLNYRHGEEDGFSDDKKI